MARTSTDEGGSFTAEERAREVRSQRKNAQADPEPEVLAKIAELPEADRLLAERVHALVREAAPHLAPKLWYGMPAYARDGRLVVFFQAAAKFKARYATLGFDQGAALDDGAMWPTAYALTELTPEVEDRIRDLVARAAG